MYKKSTDRTAMGIRPKAVTISERRANRKTISLEVQPWKPYANQSIIY